MWRHNIIIHSKYSPAGLGRCKSQSFIVQGKATIQIVSFYRPVPPNQGGSVHVYAQHLTIFSEINIIVFPGQAFLTDLEIQITSCTNEGDRLIVTGDLNEYIFSHCICRCFSNIEMRELILEKYGSWGPATTRSNKGSHDIYSLCVSQLITISEGSYLPYH